MRQIIFSNNCKASCTKTMYKIIDAMLMLYIIRCALYIERFAVQYGVNVVHIFRIFKAASILISIGQLKLKKYKFISLGINIMHYFRIA